MPNVMEEMVTDRYRAYEGLTPSMRPVPMWNRALKSEVIMFDLHISVPTSSSRQRPSLIRQFETSGGEAAIGSSSSDGALHHHARNGQQSLCTHKQHRHKRRRRLHALFLKCELQQNKLPLLIIKPNDATKDLFLAIRTGDFIQPVFSSSTTNITSRPFDPMWAYGAFLAINWRQVRLTIT